MARVTIFLLLASTAVVIGAFVNGLNTVREPADVLRHSYWGLAALFAVLGANFFALFHAAQSDRLIRALRWELERELEKNAAAGDPENPAA